MKFMIASDLHGSAFFTKQLLSQFDDLGCDRLLLLGDLLYHGARNDLPGGYAPKEVIAMLNERSDRILCIRGNCDSEVDQMVMDGALFSGHFKRQSHFFDPWTFYHTRYRSQAS